MFLYLVPSDGGRRPCSRPSPSYWLGFSESFILREAGSAVSALWRHLPALLQPLTEPPINWVNLAISLADCFLFFWFFVFPEERVTKE